MQKKKDIPLLKNLITTVKSSVGSEMFRRLYINNRADKGANSLAKDILRNGDLSCAYYVSSILKLFNLIGEIHATVGGTVRALKAHGWTKINDTEKTPEPGAVIVWAPRKFKNGETHRHIGFFIGGSGVSGGRAISNNSKKRSPQIHKWDSRTIEAIFWNAKLKP